MALFQRKLLRAEAPLGWDLGQPSIVGCGYSTIRPKSFPGRSCPFPVLCNTNTPFFRQQENKSRILHKHLNGNWVCAKWVPKLLTLRTEKATRWGKRVDHGLVMWSRLMEVGPTSTIPWQNNRTGSGCGKRGHLLPNKSRSAQSQRFYLPRFWISKALFTLMLHLWEAWMNQGTHRTIHQQLYQSTFHRNDWISKLKLEAASGQCTGKTIFRAKGCVEIFPLRTQQWFGSLGLLSVLPSDENADARREVRVTRRHHEDYAGVFATAFREWHWPFS